MPDNDKRLMDYEQLFKWICRIETTWNDKTTGGTGFLVNIPRTDVRCIMTAGHNLVRQSANQDGPKIRPKEVKLTFSGKQESFVSKEPSEWKVHEIYDARPDDSSAPYDYGVIAISNLNAKETAFPEGGFGYSVRVLVDVIDHSQVGVFGYPNAGPGEQSHLQGDFGSAHVVDNQILYELHTLEGESGGPVWIRNRTGDNSVVGIHNYGKKPGKTENRATWLTLEVLEKVLTWINYPGLSQSARAMFQGPGSRLIPSEYLLCIPKMLPDSTKLLSAFFAHETAANTEVKFAFIPIETRSYKKSTALSHTNIYMIRPEGSNLVLASQGGKAVFGAYGPKQEQVWFILHKAGTAENYEIRKQRGWNEEDYDKLRAYHEKIESLSLEAQKSPYLAPIPNVELVHASEKTSGTKFEIK